MKPDETPPKQQQPVGWSSILTRISTKSRAGSWQTTTRVDEVYLSDIAAVQLPKEANTH